ncbi:hypothetical protein B0H63DRAFT_227307 [Podospora didyma]|uniref:Uncharacterized protein n=1 Tax=Podospora didyma TaxID=330526 RepID=A0AAE0KK94_9PEZI|nr:hypothetical protein B0H63DRAFT_227307 [Podospora didyma]
MDSFKLLKRRTTDLLHSLPQSLPAMPAMPTMPTLPDMPTIKNPMAGRTAAQMKATWEKIAVPPVPRSSPSANVVAGTVYIFGGETGSAHGPDNAMHAVTLASSGAQADYFAIKAKAAVPSSTTAAASSATSKEDTKGKSPATQPELAADQLGSIPATRVGHASAVIGHRIFLFGGRQGGGGDGSMAPLDEGGRVWVFDTRTHLWSFLDPVFSPGAAATTVAVPPPRSHHAAVATDKPRDFNTAAAQHRQAQKKDQTWREWATGADAEDEIVGTVAERATDADAEGYGTLIIHGGCLADGSRASDVWAFDVHSRAWQRLPDAPGTPLGAPALALSRSRLFRFGGSTSINEDEDEEGGQLDYLDLGVDSFDDEFSAGEVSITARGGWQSLIRGKENVGYKEVDTATNPLTRGDGDSWPGARTAAALEAITVGGGREFLVLMFGERVDTTTSTSNKFWDDVWAFQVPAQGLSPASVADTVLSAVGRKSGEGRWVRVATTPYDDEDDASLDGPGARGYMASATLGDLEESGIVIWGGLSAEGGNQRLGEGWILRLG